MKQFVSDRNELYNLNDGFIHSVVARYMTSLKYQWFFFLQMVIFFPSKMIYYYKIEMNKN